MPSLPLEKNFFPSLQLNNMAFSRRVLLQQNILQTIPVHVRIKKTKNSWFVMEEKKNLRASPENRKSFVKQGDSRHPKRQNRKAACCRDEPCADPVKQQRSHLQFYSMVRMKGLCKKPTRANKPKFHFY